jgi:hypothetical protein
VRYPYVQWLMSFALSAIWYDDADFREPTPSTHFGRRYEMKTTIVTPEEARAIAREAYL